MIENSTTFYSVALPSSVVRVEVNGVVSCHDEVSVSKAVNADGETWARNKAKICTSETFFIRLKDWVIPGLFLDLFMSL